MECNGIPSRESLETIQVDPEHLAAFTLPEEALEYQPEGEDAKAQAFFSLEDQLLHLKP